MRESNLTAQRLRELVEYNPETGVMRARIAQGKRRSGDVLGTKHAKGYLKASVDLEEHLVHRLVWLYVHGSWPTGQIDHRNGNRADNRLSNLRDATGFTNQQNRKGPNRNNSSGARGVNRNGKGWRAEIGAGGRAIYLGTHADFDAAVATRRAAERTYHQEAA